MQYQQSMNKRNLHLPTAATCNLVPHGTCRNLLVAISVSLALLLCLNSKQDYDDCESNFYQSAKKKMNCYFDCNILFMC